MPSSRNTTIDFLRGLAVLLMIFVHATAYFWRDKTVYMLWDYTHIIVPLFVFCSAFIFFQKEKPVLLSFEYIFKRLKRLVFPYYIYLVLFVVLGLVSNPQGVTFEKIIKQILLGQGRDIGWLVILFTYLLFLIPIIHFMYKAKKGLFIILAIASTSSTVLLLFYTVPVPFRFVMWLPWSFFLIQTLLFSQYHANKYVAIGTLAFSSLAFFLSRDILLGQHKTLVLTENKYPPNLYYLSYGIFFTTIFYYFHIVINKNEFYKNHIQKWFNFLSNHSYSLFFIHFLFVKLFVDYGWYKILGWWWFFIALVVLSVLTQEGMNYANRTLLKKRPL